MSLDTLRAEITDDPLSRGYAGMTTKEIRVSLYTEDCSRDVESVTGQQIFEAVVPAHYNALSADYKQLFGVIVGMGTIMVSGPNTRAALTTIFSGATETLQALAALQSELVSRAVELGLGPIALSDIDKVRP